MHRKCSICKILSILNHNGHVYICIYIHKCKNTCRSLIQSLALIKRQFRIHHLMALYEYRVYIIYDIAVEVGALGYGHHTCFRLHTTYFHELHVNHSVAVM